MMKCAIVFWVLLSVASARPGGASDAMKTATGVMEQGMSVAMQVATNAQKLATGVMEQGKNVAMQAATTAQKQATDMVQKAEEAPFSAADMFRNGMKMVSG